MLTRYILLLCILLSGCNLSLAIEGQPPKPKKHSFCWPTSYQQKILPKKQITAAELSPNGKTLVTVDFTGKIIIWSTKNAVKINYFETKVISINNVVYSPAGTLLATSSGVNFHIWDINKRKLLNKFTIPNNSSISKIVWKTKNDILLTTYDKFIYKIDLDDENQTQLNFKTLVKIREEQSTGGLSDLSLSANGEVLVSEGHCKRTKTLGSFLFALNLDNGRILFESPCLESLALHMSLGAKGQIIAASSKSNDISLWNLTTKEKVGILSTHDEKNTLLSILFSPVSSLLVSSSGVLDGKIKWWDITTQKVVTVKNGPKHSFGGRGAIWLKFSKKQDILMTASDKEVLLWGCPTIIE